MIDSKQRPMAERPSMVDVLRTRASCEPEDPAFSFLSDGESIGAQLTYGGLDQKARAIAAALQAADLEGERAILVFPPGLEFIAAFFGCLYAGVVAVPVSVPLRPGAPNPALGIIKDAEPRAVLTVSSLLPVVQAGAETQPHLREARWLTVEECQIDGAEEWRDPGVGRDDLALLQYTSGSTGTPKGVMVSHGNLLRNVELIRQALGTSKSTVGVNWLPLFHDMGLIGTMVHMAFIGGHQHVMSPVDFVRRPVRWLQAVDRFRASLSGAPNFAFEICLRKIGPEQRQGLDLSCWRVAFIGTEPVRASTVERFAETFKPHGFRAESFFPGFGLAEATLVVTGGPVTVAPTLETVDTRALKEDREIRPALDGAAAQKLVSSGEPWERIVITDPATGTLLPPERIGEIWICGPSVAQGYWNRPQETARAFQAEVTGAPELGRFLRTGDLGFIKDGEVYVSGRLKDLIIIAGRNIYPQDVEQTVEKSHPDIRAGCCAAFSVDVADEERLAVVAEVSQDALVPGEIIKSIRRQVAEHHDLPVRSVALIEPRSIPKTTSGKIRRQACRTAFLDGTLATVPEQPEALR